MKGLYEWLDYVNQYAAFSYGQYWDPLREIRAEIQNSLGMISGKNVDWQKLIASGEWVCRKTERGDRPRPRTRRRKIRMQARR